MPGVATARRPVALIPPSSIARASETGVTDPKRRPPAGTPAADGFDTSSRSRATRTTSSAFAMTPPPEMGHSPNRAFFAWRSATRLELSSAWSDDAGPSLLLSVVRRRSWGSTAPFAGLIPHPGGHSRHMDVAAWQVASSRRPTCRFGISAGPGPPVVRAPASAPIDFRRGDRPPVGVNEICKSDRPRMRMASTSGLHSRLRSISRAARLATRNDPALGFASCRVVGHVAAHRSGLDPAADHQPPEPGAVNSFAARDSYPLMGLPTSFPSRAISASCSPGSPGLRSRLAFASDVVPYSVLMGLMPCRPEIRPRGLIRPAPCLRFCTFRERDVRSIRSSRRGASADLNLFKRQT